jgi:hypothetical protein
MASSQMGVARRQKPVGDLGVERIEALEGQEACERLRCPRGDGKKEPNDEKFTASVSRPDNCCPAAMPGLHYIERRPSGRRVGL